MQPSPNFATCSAGTARASVHKAELQLRLPGTSQGMLTLGCSLKITDVTTLLCVLQCQEQGFFTNNPQSSLPRQSQPKQRCPAQSPAHRHHPTPCALQDGQRSKGRGSSRACKKQEHGFIMQHNITSREPRQVTEQLARILSRQNFQAPHAAGRTWQCPQAPAPSRSSCSPQLPLSQTPSRGRVMWVQTTSAGGGRTFYSFPSHALQNPAEDSTQSAGQSPLPAPCPRARRVRRPPELLGRRAAPHNSASATASP